MKKALIIGGSGGLSSVVARKAMENGYEVWALTRGQRKLLDGVNAIIADRNDEEEFEKQILAQNFTSAYQRRQANKTCRNGNISDSSYIC